MFLLFALQEHLLAFKCLATIFVQHSFLIRQRWFAKLWLFEAAIETLERQSICAKKRIEPLWSAFIVCSLSWRRHLSIDDKWRVLFLLVAWRYHETLVAWSLQVFLNKNNGEFPLIFQRFLGIDRGLLEKHGLTETCHCNDITRRKRFVDFYRSENQHGGSERTLVKAVEGKNGFNPAAFLPV